MRTDGPICPGPAIAPYLARAVASAYCRTCSSPQPQVAEVSEVCAPHKIDAHLIFALKQQRPHAGLPRGGVIQSDVQPIHLAPARVLH